MSDKTTFRNIENPPKEYYQKTMTNEWYSIILQGLGNPMNANDRAKVNKLLEDWIYCYDIRTDFLNIKIATVFKADWKSRICQVDDDIRFESQLLKSNYASIRSVYHNRSMIDIVRIHKNKILDDETYQYYKEEYDDCGD